MYQFGFREGHSTILALTEITEHIYDALDKGKYALGVYLDLTKAFDMVCHHILLDKLYRCGIRGVVHEWFRSYLTNRKQYVYVNGTKSEVMEIASGVPQGSVLGPLLFFIYVNDIQNAVNNDNKLILFADDTNIFVISDKPEQLITEAEHILKQLSIWFEDNKLLVSLAKTQFSIFHTRNRDKCIPPVCNSISLNNNIVIHRVNSAKYLGIILDEKLNWTDHVSALRQTVVKYAGSFKIIARHVPITSKIQLYYAYVYSRIHYGIEVYGHISSQNIKRLQIVQNRTLKILFNRDFYEPTNMLHSELSILKVSDISLKNTLLFVHKHQKGKLSDIFNSYYMSNNNVHSYNTRNETKLHEGRAKTNLGKNIIKIKGAKLFNTISEEITQLKSTNKFKGK